MSNGTNEAATVNAVLYDSRLEPRCIRLLYVEPPGPRCTFETFSLDDVPAYHAISYTWRSAEIESHKSGPLNGDIMGENCHDEPENGAIHYLEVDGQHHRVSKNIRDIIMRANEFDDVNYLWIDSLCINQADPVERSAQVSMMGDIYNAAEDVAVWLGWDERNEMPTVEGMCKIIQKEYLRQKEAWSGPNFLAEKTPNLFEPATRARLGLSAFEPKDLLAFARFWDRRWFHRAWVVQEAALTTNTRFFWHRTEMDSQMLYDVSRFLMDADTGLSASSATSVSLSQQTRPRNWFVLQRRLGETLAKVTALKTIMGDSPHLEFNDGFWRKLDALAGPGVRNGEARTDCLWVWTHMLEIFRAFDATDPRDHVYATLGIIKVTASNHDLDPPPIVVDYTLSVADVYADTARHIMEAGNCVNLLCLAQDPPTRNQKDIPSWVPDFSAGYNCPILMDKPTRSTAMSNVYTLAQSAGNEARNFSIDDDLKFLKVRALHLDEVVAVGEDQNELTNEGMWEKTAQILLSHPSFSANFSSESRIESLWRTMIANTSYSGRDIAPIDIGSDFKAYMLTTLVVMMQHEPDHLDTLPSLKRLLEEELASSSQDEPDAAILTWPEILSKAAEADRRWRAIEAGGPFPEKTPLASKAARFVSAMEPMFFRRIILTRKGHLGIGPLSTQPGDLVWLMPDAPLPIVLREVACGNSGTRGHDAVGPGGRHTVLGEAYLHGDPDFGDRVDGWRWIELE